MSAGTDYDARIRPPAGLFEADLSVDELRTRRAGTRSGAVDAEEVETFELPAGDLPAADLLDDDLTVPVVPMSGYEFRCSRCFLVHHRSRRVGQAGGEAICRDCA